MAAPLATALGDYGNEDTHGDITSPGTAYGMVLDGSLVLATCDLDFDGNDQTFTVQDAETDRDGVVPTATPTYYIKHNVNLNQNVSFHVGTASTDGEPEESAGNDDSWSTTAINVAAQSNDDWLEANLPSGNNDFDLATITTCDQCDNSETHAVTINIAADNQGMLSSNVTITLSAFTGYLTEDIATAQQAYWIEPAPLPGQNDADILGAVLSQSHLESLYALPKSTAENEVNDKCYIESYSLTLDAVTASTTSALSKLAAMRNKTDASVFEEGDQVVLKTGDALDYQVTVDGVAKTIASGDVFGIFVHEAPAAE
jgi:hypothetical protein